MTAIIAELPVRIAGDAWARFTPAAFTPAAKATEAQELDALVQQYLALGGEITEVPMGATSEVTLDPALRAQVGTSRFTVDEHIAHNAKRQRKATAKDLALVEKIKALLPVSTRSALCTALRVSDGKVVALIQAYLADSEDAMALLKPRHEKDKGLDKVRLALDLGIEGYYEVSAFAGITYNTLKKLEAKYKLHIKRKPRGFHSKEAQA